MSLEKVPSNVQTLAADLEAALSYDATGTGSIENAEDIFTKHLPEGLSFDQLKAGQDFMIDATAAQTLAAGRKSQTFVTKDQATTSLRTQLGHARLETSYERHKSGTAMGKEWNKYGATSSDLTVGVGRKTSGYKAVVSYLGEEAQKVFAN